MSDSAYTPREDLIEALTKLGISRNAATRGLFYTGNYSADLAAAWVFENQDQDLERPLNMDNLSDSSEDEVEESMLHKMVIVVNSELKMGVGKVAAQVGHGVIGVYKTCMSEDDTKLDVLDIWDQCGEPKIVVKGDNAAQLVQLQAQADTLGLSTYLVQDAGKTQVAAGSTTALAILGRNQLVDQVTGTLQLL